MNRKVKKTGRENVDFVSTDLFDPDDYLYFYERAVGPEITARQIKFLIEKLNLTPPLRILDLACGHGRHSNKLAEHGLSVVGVDNNQHLLELAKREATSTATDLHYTLRDMRDLTYSSEFDRVLLLYTSFGYFSDDDNRKVLEHIAAALKPKGLLCFDIHNRDMFLEYMHPCTVTQQGKDLMININSFDPMRGRWNCRRLIIRGDGRKEIPFSVRLYNFTEISGLIEGVGLSVRDVYASWEGDPFAPTSHQTIIIAEKEG